MSSWLDWSEAVTGLIIEKRISLGSVSPDQFCEPYDNIIFMLKEGEKLDRAVKKHGISTIQAATSAAQAVNGLGDITDFVGILEQSRREYSAGATFEKVGRKLQQGKDTDLSELIASLEGLQNGHDQPDFIPLSQIEARETPFVKTGWPAIDDNIAGIPQVGLVVVGAPPGYGKTTTMIKLAGCFAREHRTKTIAIFTIEMMKEEFRNRVDEIWPNMPEIAQDRLHINDHAGLTVYQVINKAAVLAAQSDLGMIMIDFADLLVEGKTDSGEMEVIYKSLALAAKNLEIPVVLISQLSGGYEGGIPRPNNLRWTRLAEALAWCIIMVYNPFIDWYEGEDDRLLRPVSGTSYLVVWKIRGGFRIHPGPGAIRIPWRGDRGWGNTGRWIRVPV